jgi:hypothetical protein
MREPGSLSLTDRDFSARSEQTETAMFTNPYLANEFARRGKAKFWPMQSSTA